MPKKNAYCLNNAAYIQGELPNKTRKEIEEMAETAFRRGFQQGVIAALEALENGKTDAEIEQWKQRVSAWRFKHHKGQCEYPEWLGG